ncbi:hypothetical protein DDF62_21595 [Caulobacter radicis]|nr:CPCC family cysteine-rich protein [Caulobacter radicis]PVM84705.1 hypothetical protein DDF62_21595 [Caulobacter radicis]
MACACCGYVGLAGRGDYEICRICFWEDDPFQFADPTSGGGANPPSLVEAQRSYAEHGVSELRFASNVRKVRWTDRKDRAWRPFEDGDHVSTGTLAEFDGVPYWMRNR